MSIELREAEDENYERVRRFSYENFTTDYARIHHRSIDEVREEIAPPAEKRHPDDHWFLIFDDAIEIGFLRFIVLEKKDEVFGYDIFIYPEHRNRGHGSEAMVAAQALLRSLGIRTVKINVFKENSIAQGLYRKLGFTVSKEDARHFEMAISL